MRIHTQHGWLPVLMLLVATEATANSTRSSTLVTAPNPYAQHVVQTSNEGLEDNLVNTASAGGSSFQTLADFRQSREIKVPDIPDVSTTGLLCQLLTRQPAQGCLETQLSRCTTQRWCTSASGDSCTDGDWCTIAAQCTNTQGCTDAGVCTQANGCTGTAHCTEGSGCTQHSSCTNGANCTDDAGTCTGGANCTSGTGCTNGANCTAGSGCTADAQCTSGPSCTSSGGANCTSGANCTAGASCPNSSVAALGGHGGEVHGGVTRPVPGLEALAGLHEIGLPDPNLDPHFAPRERMAGLCWLALLILPGFLFRRRCADPRS